MSQEELAKACGLEQTAISTVEVGRVKNPRKLEIIAEKLGVPVSWLRFGEATLLDLSEEHVQAMFKLRALSHTDQAMIIEMIERLTKIDT